MKLAALRHLFSSDQAGHYLVKVALPDGTESNEVGLGLEYCQMITERCL